MTDQAGRNSVSIGRISVDPLTLDGLLAELSGAVQSGGRISVTYANAHAVSMAQDDPEFRAAMRGATHVFCDGKAVQWAARFLGHPLPERFTPPDWIDELCRRASSTSRGMFFLGAEPGVASEAAARLSRAHPGVRIASHHGFFDRSGSENQVVLDLINDFGPDFLLVGFGMPVQELWIAENRDRLQASVIIAVGGLFDFVSGRKTRGPRWLTDIGLEWLTRLVREPRRLGRRYLLGNPRFLSIVLRQKLDRRPAP